MTRLVSILLIAGLVPLLTGVVYVTSSILVSDEAAVIADADEHVERARRLLHRYSESQERLTELLDQLAREGVHVELTREQVDRILEEDRSILEDAEEVLRARSRGPAVSRRRDIEERYRTAGGRRQAALTDSRGFGGSLSQMGKSIVDGAKVRDRILAGNERLLNDALTEITQALAVTRGEVTGDSHPYANRLEGVILTAQAAAAGRRAHRLRVPADEPRRLIVELAGRVNGLAVEQQLIEVSRVRDRLDALREDADRIGLIITGLSSSTEHLDATIRDLEGRIGEFRERARSARQSMEALEDNGLNLLDPRGFEAFAAEYMKLAKVYRNAIAQAHRLQFGTLQNVRIDDSGDYLRGRYVPDGADGAIDVQRGLVDYQHDRAIAALDLQRNTDTLEGIEGNIAEFDALQRGYAESVAAAKAESDRARSAAAEAYRVALQHINDADDALKNAARKARSAISALKSAASLASSRARDAADRISGANPAAQDRSPFKRRSQDRWLAGQVSNELAQAQFLLASILYDRYAAAEADALLASIAKADLEIGEADPDEFALRGQQARDRGIEAARRAIRELEESSRELNSSWTVAAQAGGAHYLLALLESPAHIETARANYETAVDGRESASYTLAIVERLKQLRSR